MRRHVRMLCCNVAGTAFLGFAASAAQSQATPPVRPDQANSNQLEEIVVTAQKREQNLQSVGISVSAVPAVTLQRLSVISSENIIDVVPNVNLRLPFGAGTNANYSIRGVSQVDPGDGTESPVAIYIDDVYMASTSAGSFPLYDMARVEVLRGPQGTLFGRNSTAGLIHFISNRPEHDFASSGTIGYGSYNSVKTSGMLNLPIGEKVAFRIAGNYQSNDGWLRNVTGLQPPAGAIKTQSVRGELLLEPIDTVTDVIKISYDHASGNSQGYVHTVGRVDPATGLVDRAPPGAVDAFGEPTFTDASNNTETKLHYSRFMVLENKLDWELGGVKITSVTAYSRIKKLLTSDCDGGPVTVCEAAFPLLNRQFSQELRAFGSSRGFRWTVGAFYLDQKLNASPIGIVQSAPNTFISTEGTFRQVAQSIAAFANLEYDLTKHWTVVLGARASHERKTLDQVSGLYTGIPPFSAAGYAGFPDIISFPHGAILGQTIFNPTLFPDLAVIKKYDWSGKAELDYKPRQNVLIYTSASRGVKAPGFNTGTVGAISPAAVPFKSETLYSFEGGLKSQFFNNKLRLNLSAFYYDYHNYQSLSFNGLSTLTTNLRARVYGLDAEVDIKPVRGLTLELSGGLLNTRAYNVRLSALITADRQLVLAPKWSTEGMIRYEWSAFGDAGTLGVQANYTAKAARFGNPNNDPITRSPPFAYGDLRVDYTAKDDRYSISAFVNNFTNARYVVNSAKGPISTIGYDQLGRPRWAGVSLTFNVR